MIDGTEFKTGAEIDCYKILQKLGQGGMGVVYKVLAPDHNVYALKIMLDKNSLGPDAVERFKMEVSALSRIEHKNIVKIYGVGVWRGSPYFVMDYLDGISLGKYLKTKKTIDYQEVLQIGWRIALALSSIHKIKIIHRDIKPDNIILVDGKPYLMDFSIARAEKKSEQRLTQTGVIIGTVNYMPLEQAKGDQTKIGPWTDIYALGATMFHLLTGIPPFDGANNLEVLLRLSQEDLPSVRKYVPKIPKAVDLVLQKATNKNIEARYQSAELFASDLRAILHHKKISIDRPEVVIRKKVGKLALSKLILYSVFLVGLAVGWFLLGTRDTENFVPPITSNPSSTSPTNTTTPVSPTLSPTTSNNIPPSTPPSNTSVQPLTPEQQFPKPTILPEPPPNTNNNNFGSAPTPPKQGSEELLAYIESHLQQPSGATILNLKNKPRPASLRFFTAIPPCPIDPFANLPPAKAQEIESLQQQILQNEQSLEKMIIARQRYSKDADALREKIALIYLRLNKYYKTQPLLSQEMQTYARMQYYLADIGIEPNPNTLILRMACYAQVQKYAHLRRDVELLEQYPQHRQIANYYREYLTQMVPFPALHSTQMPLWQAFHVLSYASAWNWDFEKNPELFIRLQDVYKSSRYYQELSLWFAYIEVLVLLKNHQLKDAQRLLEELPPDPEFTRFAIAMLDLHNQRFEQAIEYFHYIDLANKTYGGNPGNETLNALQMHTSWYLQYFQNQSPPYQAPPDMEICLGKHLDLFLQIIHLRLLGLFSELLMGNRGFYILASFYDIINLEIGYYHLCYVQLGEVYLKIGYYHLAEHCITTGILSNHYNEAVYLLGKVYCKQEKFLLAKQCFDFCNQNTFHWNKKFKETLPQDIEEVNRRINQK